jgi:hypothetical protein
LTAALRTSRTPKQLAVTDRQRASRTPLRRALLVQATALIAHARALRTIEAL